MFCKMLIAIPALAAVMTLCLTENASSQAFARGGRGGRGFSHMHRGYGGHFNHYHRYGWGYPSYGYYGYETPVYESVVPICSTCEPVVTPEVAPVCTTCEPTYFTGYNSYWGYGRYRNHYHGGFFGHRGGGRRR